MTENEAIKMDSLKGLKKTYDCGSLRKDNTDQEVVLMGWVNSRRDLGNLIFIDLRDRGGITQIVFDPAVSTVCHSKAHALRNEWVVAVKGTVTPRLPGQENPDLPTGEIELKVNELRILNRTETPPFQVDGAVDASEALRLKYRYLELRRPQMFEAFYKRHLIAASVREHLNQNGFVEVETPFLTKSTPEGARDYLVPSRVNPGMFYALPQSPQLFKQLLMVAGFDRYYQIVRCFRDEDLRSDRQPEFTQVDLEMAFIDEEGVMEIFEGMMEKIFREILGLEISLPIVRLGYQEAMDRFGTDRPDMRFSMEIKDISTIAARSEFKIFKQALNDGGAVKAVRVRAGGEFYSRKKIDELASAAVNHGAKGLAWIKVTEKGWQSSLDKFFTNEDKTAVNRACDAHVGDLILIVADQKKVANEALGAIRLDVAQHLDMIEDKFSFVWITQFPLFEYDDTEKRLSAVHHPFTAPMEEDTHLLDSHPEQVRARAYDLVVNGTEIGGGSVRIHNTTLQENIFRILGISPDAAQMKFGFLLEALKYGAPPHGGMALGFDRLVAIMTGVDSIREVIAFPKTTSGACLLTEAPSRVDGEQLKELGLREIIRERQP